MSNVRPSPDFTPDDKTSLGKDAKTAKERRATLIWCLDNVWKNKDIGRLERVDNNQRHGWRMWRWQTWTV